MEIREFAEQILLSGSIRDKCLSGLEDFTDLNPVSRQGPLALPVRDSKISFNWEKKAAFPSVSVLHKEFERAKILHYFANHELLALELMAQALLKFPQAPRPFRLGLANIMCEEQKHLRLYIARMQKLGLDFGEEPLNGFFWKVLAQPKDIVQFTTQMSLTLEQANLDHCLYFENIFRTVSDTKSASLMRTVFEDEVGHVRHGVNWINKWRGPAQNQWDFYLANLPLGFSAMRAKGKLFSSVVRESIGFDTQYIENLKVFSQSKGRAPHVFWFHPFVELELAAGNKNISPPKILKSLKTDLALLPMYFAATDDAVLVTEKPSSQFLAGLRDCGLAIPEFVKTEDLIGRRLRSFAPWGWSHGSHAVLKQLSGLPNTSFFENESLAPEFYSKAFGVRCLQEFLAEQTDLAGCLGDSSSIGRVCASATEVEVHVEEFRTLGFKKFVLKNEYGLSGKNQKIFEGNAFEGTKPWLAEQFAKGQKIVLEPWLEKVFDFSFQFTMCESGELKKLGLVRFLTDAYGKYRGALLGGFHLGLNNPTLRFINQKTSERPLIEEMFLRIEKYLNKKMSKEFRPRALGVDAFVYRDPSGDLKIRPIVEINPRYNMGTVTSKIEARLMPRRVAQWLILTLADIKRLGFEDFKVFRQRMTLEFPLKIGDVGRPQIDSGVLFTTDPDRAEHFVSVLIVAKSLEELNKNNFH
ncbi:MAG: DUF455 family protein [Pseudomonadota bacterium]|nr:DUF455 family protein [Pseudomonadota bacterium]